MSDKLVHSIALEAFSYPSEDAEKVAKAIAFVFPKGKLKEESIESYFGPKITRHSALISNPRQVADEISYLVKKIPDSEKKQIIKTLEDRIDDEGNVHIRFSKQDALDEKFSLQYKGDVIKLKIKMVSYPFVLEKVKKNMVKILEAA
jgi:hypothetical protein